jgi:hypothetical protein
MPQYIIPIKTLYLEDVAIKHLLDIAELFVFVDMCKSIA